MRKAIPIFGLAILGGVIAACGNTSSNTGDDPFADSQGGSSNGGTTTSTGGQGVGAGNGTGAGVGAGAAKNAGGTQSVLGGGGAAGASGGSAPAGGMQTSFGQGGGINLTGGSGGSTGDSGCATDPNADNDKDGWTVANGDCNDCDPNVNPGAIDILQTDMNGNPLPMAMQVDSNCDGIVPTPGMDTSCDANIPVGAPSGSGDACRAMELCNIGVPDDNAPNDKNKIWGVIDATFNRIDAPVLGGSHSVALKTDWGVLDNFGSGTHPQGGKRLLGLSSGEARTPSQPDFTGDQCDFDKGYSSGFPGLGQWPKNGSCGTTGTPHDGVALDLKLRVPTNAKAMSFNFRFFTCEYPVYTCEVFNDVFAVLMVDAADGTTSPLMMSDPMYPDVAFESSNGMKNVIGVNNQTFLTACQPGTANKGNYPNCMGEAQLQGSGFEGHAASAWLVSQVPVQPGHTYYLRIAIWDSEDGILDSTAVIDNFTWQADPGMNASMPGTSVAPNPH